MAGKRHGEMSKGQDGKQEIRVSPAIYKLLVMPDGSLTDDFDAVAKNLKVEIVKRRRAKIGQ